METIDELLAEREALLDRFLKHEMKSYEVLPLIRELDRRILEERRKQHKQRKDKPL